MTFQRTKLHILQKSESLRKRARTGLSLHCHTQHSKEELDFLPIYASRLPLISRCFHKEVRNYEARSGRCIDWGTAYWSPPMTPQMVFKEESSQLNSLGLNAIVSITDHDCIEANLDVNRTSADAKTPISMEWTVPFRNGFFHLGVHNLPEAQANAIVEALVEYTKTPALHSDERLTGLFEMLQGDPEILVVLNHPLWDIELAGQKAHKILLNDFLAKYKNSLHSIELNGFRSWSENKKAVALAESLELPVVAGGDRHGSNPNTVLNISKLETFDEFADEIRSSRKNEVVLMPDYRRPLLSRQLESFAQILGEYPDLDADRAKWIGRLFFDVGDGRGLKSAADLGVVVGPAWIRRAIRTLGVLGNPKLGLLFRFVRRREDRIPFRLDLSNFGTTKFDDTAGRFSSEPVH